MVSSPIKGGVYSKVYFEKLMDSLVILLKSAKRCSEQSSLLSFLYFESLRSAIDFYKMIIEWTGGLNSLKMSHINKVL